MTRTTRSTAVTAAVVTVLLYLALSAHCRSGAGRPFFVLAFLCAGAGYWFTARWRSEDAAADDAARRRVLLAAGAMVAKERRLNDLALASRLGLPQEQVSRWIDFGMNHGWLPMDASEGMPARTMGCAVVDVLRRPMSFGGSRPPVLYVDGGVSGRGYGSFLATLPEGPHRLMVMTRHRMKGAGGVSRLVTQETGLSVFVRSGGVTGAVWDPTWNLFGGGRFREYPDPARPRP